MVRRLSVAGMLLLTIGVAGCGLREKVADSAKELDVHEATEILVVPVEAGNPRRGPISAYFETTTRIAAENQVDVTSEGVGTCISVEAEEGDYVSRGDVLAELDKEEALASLREAEVQVRKQRSDYDIAKQSLAEGLISKSEYDNARFAYEQGMAALARQKVQIENLTVRAPISGVVTKRTIQVGMLVSSGTPVFSIVDPSSFRLIINPPERELPRLHVGQVAEVSVDALEDEQFVATVSRINPGVDAVSGTVKVVLDFDGADRERLREAAFARVRLVMDTHEDALLVTKDAVVEESARRYLFVVREEVEPGGEGVATAGSQEQRFIADRVEVETGLEDSDSIEILSGIDEGALVITRGQYNLKPGTQVKVTNIASELASRSSLSADEALEAARTKREAKAEASPRSRDGS